ncbi:MAG: (4Fe-4S)-binding protein [Propionibacteriaceae bacterium]|jgi:uncharacterized Fe-S cluster protein YjdI|nr:(4Fe-4S)-binding protein [Propionibacteriaceae bacterium]
MTRKLYTGPIVDLTFDGDVCQHAGECVRGMPAVFNVHARPWANPEAANTPDLAALLREVIGRCPSGALQVAEHQAA